MSEYAGWVAGSNSGRIAATSDGVGQVLLPCTASKGPLAAERTRAQTAVAIMVTTIAVGPRAPGEIPADTVDGRLPRRSSRRDAPGTKRGRRVPERPGRWLGR